jgi:hypothetical protein
MITEKYTSFDDINRDLKRLNLERKIALEELKAQRNYISEEIGHYSWVNWILKIGKKYGVMLLLRKVFK